MGVYKGLSFRRLPDGSVSIDEIDSKLTLHIVEPAEWAKIVAGVSRSGQTEMATEVALEFHNTDFADYEKPEPET